MSVNSHIFRAVVLSFLGWVGCEGVRGAVLWAELQDGDLPGDFTAPRILTATAGENIISGRIGQTGNLGATNGSDADYLTIVVPEGLEIVSITAANFSFSGTGNPGGGSFLAYREGFRFPGQGFGDIDGYVIFTADSGNLLPGLRQDAFGVGGDRTLGAGEHAFWLQETNPTVVEYALALEVIPEPSSTGLLGLGLAIVLGLRRRP